MVSVHACGTPGELLTLSEPGIYSIRVISAVKGAMGTHQTLLSAYYESGTVLGSVGRFKSRALSPLRANPVARRPLPA